MFCWKTQRFIGVFSQNTLPNNILQVVGLLNFAVQFKTRGNKCVHICEKRVKNAI